jgi:hypothetical protein
VEYRRRSKVVLYGCLSCYVAAHITRAGRAQLVLPRPGAKAAQPLGDSEPSSSLAASLSLLHQSSSSLQSSSSSTAPVGRLPRHSSPSSTFLFASQLPSSSLAPGWPPLLLTCSRHTGMPAGEPCPRMTGTGTGRCPWQVTGAGAGMRFCSRARVCEATIRADIVRCHLYPQLATEAEPPLR